MTATPVCVLWWSKISVVHPQTGAVVSRDLENEAAIGRYLEVLLGLRPAVSRQRRRRSERGVHQAFSHREMQLKLLCLNSEKTQTCETVDELSGAARITYYLCVINSLVRNPVSLQ